MTRKNFVKLLYTSFLFLYFLVGCSHKIVDPSENGEAIKNLTIFFINDQHGQIDNFAKIKYIVDEEKLKTNVIVACSGDIFSGNPVVDFHDQKGYPMIDMMNQVGFDISVLGNHEFDYGEEILKQRIEQANFKWVCANVSTENTKITQPKAYETITVGNVSVSFLGLLETNGKKGAVIPSTHPWRIENFTFQNHEDIVSNYSTVKKDENADLYIALTHLGTGTDYELARNHSFFDMVIGGHSHQEINETINQIPVYQSGSNLNKLGKIVIEIKNKKIISKNFELINLNQDLPEDETVKKNIIAYNNNSDLTKVIAIATVNHNTSATGCFITHAFVEKLDLDLSFQNPGGVRAGIEKGEVTAKEIYSVTPFNNQMVVYYLTVGQVKQFLKNSQDAFYYSGLEILQNGNNIVIKRNNNTLADDEIIKMGTQDYIAALYEEILPAEKTILPENDASTLITYLTEINNVIDFENCYQYFKYN
ncbi:bifunctional UDP-sugar hydrolase/5'-nucleotidase [Wenyingzhuangia sp. 1_MG-2023]|nr:bifunctional UDP-sugar hydrolase/5'-nucleotidase [Wenyingzhuangia sp. 1_MG-2023]